MAYQCGYFPYAGILGQIRGPCVKLFVSTRQAVPNIAHT